MTGAQSVQHVDFSLKIQPRKKVQAVTGNATDSPA